MIQTITGGVAKDHRGQIRFVNDFDMTQVKRFYIIKNTHTQLVRGWRAHRTEQRWFYVLTGAFSINIIRIDDWAKPSPLLPVDKRDMIDEEQRVLHVPAGYGTAIRALEPDSQLLVFADYGVEHAESDDYTWDLDYFVNRC